MRLLHIKTLQLQSFHDANLPRYAILSHTWGDEEILFDDVQNRPVRNWRKKHAFYKLEGFCRKASQNGYEYVWIDTCCIDQGSSAELSEAINSMFQWYNQAEVCYVYLEDTAPDPSLHGCRWFTRGWTLQELIAPTDVRFFDKNWTFINDRFSLAPLLAKITGIKEIVLRHGHESYPSRWEDHKSDNAFIAYCLSCGCRWWSSIYDDGIAQFSIAQRMSWAAKRATTREEDLGYCLFGLFDVNLPLLYGEGARAFTRLQEEIVQRNDDQSILAFNQGWGTILASSPECFGVSDIYPKWALDSDIEFLSNRQSKLYLANGGLSVEVLICPLRDFRPLDSDEYFIGILDCAMGSDLLSRPAILLKPVHLPEHTFRRFLPGILCCVDQPGHGRLIGSPDSDLTHFDFDIDDAQIQRITIVPEYDLRKDPVVQGTPLRIKPIIDCDPGKYTVEDTFPERLNEMMLTSCRYTPRGIIMFHKPSYPRFCVVWETRRAKPPFRNRQEQFLSMWCKVWPLDDLKQGHVAAKDDAAFAREVVKNTRMRDRSFDSVYNFDENKKAHVSSALLRGFEQRIVTAKLSAAAFLGRTIVELEVRISKVDGAPVFVS
ncbi:heterokaryon incompatibility protein-domain-containing protein [Dactylonectria macrodidyma]|uniref:Heterokaryon incompatibility protein-domain-containing protein n=1 Tax=Dactylonectria macrodidyma TaxID=307937 RepID=A0A9P9FA21_9HYPO|nr:heterokaryon incompatibility protein-domain-containing protein [Dactylonectria macrodidyma]